MNSLYAVLSLLSFAFSSVVAGSTYSEVWTSNFNIELQLSHSLDIDHPQYFTSRGNISQNTIVQNILTDNEKASLKKLAVSSKLYRMKAIIVADGVKTTFMTSAKACSVVKSFLNDVLVISLDHAGYVVSVFYKPNLDFGSPCEDLSLFELDKFSTEVSLMNVENGPIPDTTSFIQKMDRERESKERGEQQDNRSFLSKYWVYIVPCVILLLISGMTNPDNAAAAQ